jgi:hypothetical protein
MACLLAQATRHFSAVRIPALQLLLAEFHNYRTATRMRERQKKRPLFSAIPVHPNPNLSSLVATSHLQFLFAYGTAPTLQNEAEYKT